MLRFYSKHGIPNRVTIVAKHDGKTLYFAAARTGERDMFCKKTGRELAEQRLQNGQIIREVDCGKESMLELFIKECLKMETIIVNKPDSLHGFFAS